MKILTITYAYPPYHQGGYEIRCRDVMERLKQRGHEVLVLTTRHPSNWHAIKTNEPGIHRKLHHKFKARWLPVKVLFDTMDTRFIRKAISDFKPDLVYLWQIATLSDMIIPYCASLGIPLVHDVADIGLLHAFKVQKRGLYFNNSPHEKPTRKALKKIVYGIIRSFSGNLLEPYWQWPEKMGVVFNSENIKEDALLAGIPVNDARVIHAGIDTNKFSYNERNGLTGPIHIIAPGRIVPLKGTMDAILLVKRLKEQGVMAKLTLPGGVGDQEYYTEIAQIIKENEMKESIELPGMVSQEELSALYRQADICFFSSHWQSGLSAVPMEAMACGCVVITYGNENSREIIEHNQTGFIVSEGDFDGAVSIIQKLVNDTNQYQAIIECALNEIDLKYTMERYVSEIEAFLCESLEKHQEKHNGNH